MKFFTLIKKSSPWTEEERTSIALLTDTHAFTYKHEPEMLVLFGSHDKEPIATHIGTESFTHHVVTERDPLPPTLLKDIHLEIIKIASTGGDSNSRRDQ